MVLEYSKLSSVIPLTRPIKDLQQLVAVFEYDDFEVGDPRFVHVDLAYALMFRVPKLRSVAVLGRASVPPT